jgi:N-acetylglutamate synthase-like GNAT family acetyltransferase
MASAAVPMYTALPTEERIMLLANLIVDQIYEDQANGAALLEMIGGADDA